MGLDQALPAPNGLDLQAHTGSPVGQGRVLPVGKGVGRNGLRELDSIGTDPEDGS